jgi:hypothetical protein
VIVLLLKNSSFNQVQKLSGIDVELWFVFADANEDLLHPVNLLGLVGIFFASNFQETTLAFVSFKTLVGITGHKGVGSSLLLIPERIGIVEALHFGFEKGFHFL